LGWASRVETEDGAEAHETHETRAEARQEAGPEAESKQRAYHQQPRLNLRTGSRTGCDSSDG